MGSDMTLRLVGAAVDAIRGNAEELSALDRAIGDGDHGINMKRGFDAVAETAGSIAGLALPPALEKVGMTLVMKVGGASGPLYGSLFMAMGKGSAETPASVGAVAAMLGQGVDAVRKRGKSGPGEKTMLDVLVPVEAALLAARDERVGWSEALRRTRAAADGGLEATRAMKATKGRASFLGERSVGHLDPGARSSQLLVHAICDAVAAMIQSAETERV